MDTVAQVVHVLVVLIFLINLRIIPDVQIVSAVAIAPAVVVVLGKTGLYFKERKN